MKPRDLLKSGWTASDVHAAVQRAVSMVNITAIGSPPIEYAIRDGRTYWCKAIKGGVREIALANFAAEIRQQLILDDGVEKTRRFVLGGQMDNGRSLPDVTVDAAEFEHLRWVTSKWGASAAIAAGAGARDRLREAIQRLSKPSDKVVFTHTGWREMGGRWVYLFHGGAVGADGIEVELEPPLDRFVLPELSVDTCTAVEMALNLLRCGSPRIMAPLLASVFLGVLSNALRPDLVVFLQGPTGQLKSELAALAQRFFGKDFSRKTLPANWTSTENAIEARLFFMKDAVAVIDDFAPSSDRRAQAEMERKAQRIVRNVGNHSGRGRLFADLRGRPDRPARGMVISTGEDVPGGHSIRGRLVIIEVTRDALSLPEITNVQDNGHLLSQATRAFIQWLAPQMNTLLSTLPKQRDSVRATLQASTSGGHVRHAEAIALLWVALDRFFAFAASVGFDAARLEQMRSAAWQGLLELGRSQASFIEEADPAEIFMATINSLLVQGVISLVTDRNVGLEPGPNEPPATPGRGKIGWVSVSDGFAYLVPEAARAAVAGCRERFGETFPYGPKALHQALRRRGYIVSGEKGHNEVKVRLGGAGRAVRVLKIPLVHLRDGLGGLASVPGSVPGQSPVATASAGAPNVSMPQRNLPHQQQSSPLVVNFRGLRDDPGDK